jgi:hypothetical protein
MMRAGRLGQLEEGLEAEALHTTAAGGGIVKTAGTIGALANNHHHRAMLQSDRSAAEEGQDMDDLLDLDLNPDLS